MTRGLVIGEALVDIVEHGGTAEHVGLSLIHI